MNADQGQRATAFARPAVRACIEAVSSHAVIIWSFLASRLMLLAIGLLTQIHIRPYATVGNVLAFSQEQALNIWGAADSGWYMDIVLNGYQKAPGLDGQANWAFFPAFPALAAALTHASGLTPLQAMLVIANVSFFVALILVHRLTRAEFDRRTADLCVVLLCVAPGSYIFSSAYTEGLFLVCVAAGLLLLRRRKWLMVGLAAAAATLTRNLGVGLLLPYGLAALERLVVGFRSARDQRPRIEELMRIGLGGLAPLGALLAFMAYLQARTGDALAFLHVQSAWSRSLSAPFAALLRGLVEPSSVADGDLVSLAFAWLALGLLVVLAAMRRWTLLSLALFLTLVPLATGLMSFARYALVILPLWMALARILAERPRTAMGCVAVLAMLNGFMMVPWTLGLGFAS